MDHRIAVEPVVAELLAHFFRPVLRTCPACGADDCPQWAAVRELVGHAGEHLPAELAGELARMRP